MQHDGSETIQDDAFRASLQEPPKAVRIAENDESQQRLALYRPPATAHIHRPSGARSRHMAA